MMWLSQITIGGIEISPSGLWLIIGTALCLIELVIPTAFTAVCLGVSALLVSLVALLLPSWFGVQIAIWMLLSCGLIALGYRINQKRTSRKIQESTEAEALTAMMPNQTGRVLYEGASWRAKCADGVESIEPHDLLHVVDREGTTLIVMPMHQFGIKD
ncbi:NfeD family protein [Chamaesiphon sp. VAR_48_metabat_135_sub]|uniref:NfeD family protein n=1 Tax=Chamaesiphon sp. VAR_48_metabat_135_sub TaxID=2964699 RepID=UPI00286D5429|nr:NfeD family protein [Chamaesiphon sp. VAR_48_metabat_135_sub]